MAGRRINGEGTIYRRKDGRYEAAVYLLTTSGIRKRIRIYARTHAEAREKLAQAAISSQIGLLIPDRQTSLADYLDYWLEQFVRPNKRPKTYEQYEVAARLYLKPSLGQQAVTALSVPKVQGFLNQLLTDGHSVRKVQIVRTTLSAALTRAMREELVNRNVARLVELPQWQRTEIRPWSAAEAQAFLDAARPHRLYPAFLLLVLYGLRRGEVLGLRWQDVVFDSGELHIRQQLQRVGRELIQGPVKTGAGQRNLPLLPSIYQALLIYKKQQAADNQACSMNTIELAFTSERATPLEPRNFVRTFWQICQAHGIRVIKLHHIRHTTATLLKNLGVPARDAQLILGHASPWTTQQLYQHDDMDTRRSALAGIEGLLQQEPDTSTKCREDVQVYKRCRQDCRQLAVKMPSLFSLQRFYGGPSGTRTQDTLLKSSIADCMNCRITEVDRVLCVRRRQWILGLVAVRTAVKT